MNKNLKKSLLIVTIILSLAIAFIPIYFLALADSDDDFRVINQSIVGIVDGTENFDLNDDAGNDSSASNNRVRNFDSIKYTVEYELQAKNEHAVSSEGREVLVEILFPTTYTARVKYEGQAYASMSEMTFNNINYYYASFTKEVSLSETQQFDFELESINSTDITQYNSIKPLIFVKETRDLEVSSISEINNLSQDDPNRVLPNDITCGISSCDVAITGKEAYSIRMIKGEKTNNIIPIGLLIGLVNVEGKGIKGLVIPKELSFDLTKNSDKISFNTDSNSYGPYDNTSYTISIPSYNNGTITFDGSSVNINNINPSLGYSDTLDYYYFSSNYFSITVNRLQDDYSTISATISAIKDSSVTSTLDVIDLYGFTLGNYTSSIDIYGSSPSAGESTTALDYGKSNINYASNFAAKVNFGYYDGDGLSKLINYVKIDNDAFKLVEDFVGQFPNSYNFTSEGMAIESGSDSHPQVLFGFGEWTSEYFDLLQAEGCPLSISTKEEYMNLYGGPCLAEKATVKWAYSPLSENDINEQPINSTKGPLIVKSIFVPNNDAQFIKGSSGELVLYGSVVNNDNLVGSAHQLVSSAAALTAEDTPVLKYFGDATNERNFVKTNYNFTNREVTQLNTNTCENNQACSISGATILISGIKVFSPTIETYKSIDLSKAVNRFTSYPVAIKIMGNATKKDPDLRYVAAYVDLYLPKYMILKGNFDVNNPLVPSSADFTSSSEYNIYHYQLGVDELLPTGELPDNFVVYADIDPMTTPNGVEATIMATIDFVAEKDVTINNETITKSFRSISSDTDRTGYKTVILENSSAVITRSSTTPKYIEKYSKELSEDKISYNFNMIAYNHSESVVTSGYSYSDASLYYVLPYNGDLSSSELSSKVNSSTEYTVKFTADSVDLTNYDYFYITSGNPSNIMANEINPTHGTNNWIAWNNPTESKTKVLAIKVVKKTAWLNGTYFGSDLGLTVVVTPVNSMPGNIYYNSFHVLGSICDNDQNCSSSDNKHYVSSSAVTSVYAREISGFVFEDYDYNGIYSDDESKIEGIPVSLYRINDSVQEYDGNDPTTFVNEDDELISIATTGENGNYHFTGLTSGKYYVSYTIDENKYIVTDANVIDENTPNSRNNNSKAMHLSGTNKAISIPIVFDDTNETLTANNINLGLTIKKEMAISLNKYITEVTVSKNGNVEKYDYSNQNLSKVSITVQNPNSTHITVKYSFSIENTKYYPGYVGMIIDKMPPKMTFNPELNENRNWVIYDGLLYYNGLYGKLLLPNEKQYFTLVLDLDLEEAGTYRNVVSARDLILMGDELPVYDFSTLSTEGGE